MAKPITRPKDFVGLEWDEALAAVRGSCRAATFYGLPSPEVVEAIYLRGFQGVRPESVSIEQKARHREMMASMPDLYEIFPWAKDIGKGKITCPYVAIASLDKEFGGRDAQEVGDCTVHGTR